MVVSALFKDSVDIADHVSSSSAPETRIITFWLHQPTRLTDGHIAIRADGTSRITVNWSSKGKPFDVASRARHDTASRQQDAGMTAWDSAQVSALLDDLSIPHVGQKPIDAFADAVLAPIRASERQAAERLSIQWDVSERDIQDAIGLRYTVVQKAEAILNDAGLLVDQSGTVVADDEVAATLEVSEFNAAKSLLWTKLTAEERRYNCRIAQG